MKHLFLLRHVKSSWNDPTLDDFDRKLAPRGKRAAKRLARHIAAQGYHFDLVLCSAARRAKDTWDRIARDLGGDIPVIHSRELYLAGEDGFVKALRGLDDAIDAVLLVAHNPDIENFANWLCREGELCREGDSEALRQMRAKYPTGGLAAIRLDLERWAELEAGRGTLESFVAPKALGDG
jgi:phosphohistidine phosphatase